MKGTIVKGIGGFYYVNTSEGIIECKARGKFRKKQMSPIVGDLVEISVENSKGAIEKIYERKNELIRPTVANVTQAFVVFSVKTPDVNIELLNKFLILCEHNDLKITVCFNKLDLIDEKETVECIEMVKQAGYDVVTLEAKEGIGIDSLKSKVNGNVTVFCGPSGVGKSTILNKLAGRELMETGSISEKLKRGKHTTRHSELIEYNGGFIVDTPGFSSLDIGFIAKENLQHHFPEFEKYMFNCKFNGCLHYKEPNCAIKEAVESGKINKNRYNLYIKMLQEINTRRNKR